MSSNPLFEIDSDGQVSLTRPLDYEVDDSHYNFTIIASDSGDHSDTASVVIILMDENEYMPVFKETVIELSIPEDTIIGTHIYTVVAMDQDKSDHYGIVTHYRMSLLSDKFSFDVSSGAISLATGLDVETQASEYQLEIQAYDGGGLFGTSTITINVTDVNEFAPEFRQLSYTVSIAENSFPEVQPGWPHRAMLRLDVLDRDASELPLMYNISSDNDYVNITADGYIILIAAFDYEEFTQYRFTVTASDGDMLSSPAKVIIHVVAVNDNPPVFTKFEYVVCIVENMQSTVLAQLHAYDLDSGLRVCNFF